MPKLVESPSEYIQRILGNVEGRDPLQVLAATGPRLREIVRDTSPAVLRRRPAPDMWSAGEIMAHLADAEIVASWRVRSIIARDGVPLQPFDQDDWSRHLRYDEVDPAESVDLFDATRAANLRLLRRVDPKRLENHGMHAERGKETITHLIRLYAGHDLNHLRQIEEIAARR